MFIKLNQKLLWQKDQTRAFCFFNLTLHPTRFPDLNFCLKQFLKNHFDLHFDPPTDFVTFGQSPPGNTKGGSITVQLNSCLAGLESAV